MEVSSSLTEVEGELVVLSISRDISERQREVRRLEELTLRDELALARRRLTPPLRPHCSGTPVTLA